MRTDQHLGGSPGHNGDDKAWMGRVEPTNYLQLEIESDPDHQLPRRESSRARVPLGE